MRRRLRLFFLLGILLALLAWVGSDLWTGRRAEAEVARLEQRYGLLNVSSQIAPPVGPDYNSARFVRAAAVLTVSPSNTAGYIWAAASRVKQLPEAADAPADIRTMIDANREALRLADFAVDRRQASWDADYAVGGYEPRWSDVRTLSRALEVAALLEMKAGRSDDASRRLAAALSVAASIRNEPSFIGQLVRIADATEQCETVERLISRYEPSSEALATLARALADNRQTDPLRVGLLAELRWEQGRILAVERHPLGRIARPLARLVRVEYLREMERLIESQAGPRPRPPFPERPRPSHWRLPRVSSFVSTMVSGLERAIDSGDTHNSVLGVTEIAVALRRYRLDRGSYPDDLSALVPAYLPRLPIDPMTGRPPVYARRDAGFTLKAEPVRKDATPSPALEWAVGR